MWINELWPVWTFFVIYLKALLNQLFERLCFRFDPNPLNPDHYYKISETIGPNTPEAMITTLSCQSNVENPRVQFFLVDEKDLLHSQYCGDFGITEFYEKGKYKVNVFVAAPLNHETIQQYSLILRCQVNMLSVAFWKMAICKSCLSCFPFIENLDISYRILGDWRCMSRLHWPLM